MLRALEAPIYSSLPERDLQRLIDVAVGRALFDAQFARELLADPTVLLGDSRYTLQQYRDLRTIRAHDVRDFAAQALALFWPPQRPLMSEADAPRVAGL
jgi:hypothetical protein